MITDISRYMITNESLVVLDAGADKEIAKNDYWSPNVKIRSNGFNAVNRLLYTKTLKTAVFQVMEIFLKRRSDLIKGALGISVNYNGEKGTEITPEGCEQKLKEYNDCLRSIVLFYEANKKILESKNSTNDENDNTMRSSRICLLEMIINECGFIKMKEDYNKLSTRQLKGELTKNEVIETKAKVWLDIGNNLLTMQDRLIDLYRKYRFFLYFTFWSDYAVDEEDLMNKLRRQPAPETHTWIMPDCLKKAKY